MRGRGVWLRAFGYARGGCTSRPVVLGSMDGRVFPHPSFMLVLTRKPGEAIVIGDDIEIEIVAIGGGKVRVGISAPRSTTVHRKEVYVELQAQEAAATDASAAIGAAADAAAAEPEADPK